MSCGNNDDDDVDIKVSWREYLRDKQLTQLPTIWRHNIDSSISNGTTSTSESASIPEFVSDEVILAAWASVLSLHADSEDVLFFVDQQGASFESEESPTLFPVYLNPSPDENLAQTIQHVTKSLDQLRTSKGLTLTQIATLGRTTGKNYKSGTLLHIRESNGPTSTTSAQNCARNHDFGITIAFRRSDFSTEVEIIFQKTLYTQQYIAEILRQTLMNIDRLLLKAEPPDQNNNLDLVLSFTRPCEPVPRESLLHSGVESHSQRHPTTIAVGESERVMTYQELNDGADLLANILFADLPHDGCVSNVGVYFEKSSFAIMSMLAVLKAGGTYVPLDVAWPLQRITTILENAHVSTVFCSSTQRSRLTDDSIRVVIVDEEAVYKLKSSSNAQHPGRPKINTSNPAYMLYTSGSTGIPKGIPVSHSAITTSIQAMARHLNINARTRTFQYTTFTFDLNIADIWMTLTYGGRVCLPTEDERLNPDDFIDQERCNYAMLTPTAASTIDKTILHKNIKTLALIGEAVPERLLLQIATPDASLNLYNTWGPTEASVIASSSECITLKEDSFPSLHSNNIGYPIGCSIFLVSPTNPHKLAPVFAPGEIALVGNSLANGYYANPTKTEEAFRTDLEWAKNEAIQGKVGGATVLKTVYLTGDIGRYDTKGDGSIIFMQRKEGGYIKINGYRVDPGEIESRIIELATDELSAKGVCVLCHEQFEEESQGPRQTLVCFFVVGHNQATPGATCQIRELQGEIRDAAKQIPEQLRETIPDYMIPQLFVPLESMPILTSHKIDRKSLQQVLKDITWSDLVKRFGV